MFITSRFLKVFCSDAKRGQRKDEIKDNDIGSCGVTDRKIGRSKGRLMSGSLEIARFLRGNSLIEEYTMESLILAQDER